MKRTITLRDIRPQSVNSLYYNIRSQGKRAEARDWELQVIQRLWEVDNLQALKDLRDAFDPSKHSYSVHMITYTPKLYNKSGQISSRVCDLSNIEKPLLDVVFTNQFYGTNKPYEALNLNVDDKHITRLLSVKKLGDTEKIVLHIKIIRR